MKKLLHAIFLISGTAIGAGLIALPLTAVNLNMTTLFVVVAFMIFFAYRSSMMTIDLIELHKKSASIVELSKKMAGRNEFLISLTSCFYTLSFSLLTVYFAGAADSLGAFLNLDINFLIPICALLLFAILGLKTHVFSKINSVLVVILMVAIVSSMINILTKTTNYQQIPASFNCSEIFTFLPIIFTSFGVQNVCPNVYEYLDGDRKKINLAFFVGILIPAVVYVAWISCVFQNVLATDVNFFQKLQEHQVSAGELTKFLCESSNSAYMENFFKILSLFAIATSAIGIGVGLLKSIREIINSSHKTASAIICVVPALSAILIPNAFINILSFGGMIATVFVIFMPYYLLHKNNREELADIICLIFGIIIVICEIAQMLI